MQQMRLLVICLGMGLNVITIYAQDTSPASMSDTTFIAIIVTVLVVAGTTLWLWQRIVQHQRMLLDQSNLNVKMDSTEQINAGEHLQIPLDTTESRLPVPRKDGDYRPYLVLELRKSANSFLQEGERFIVTPGDTPYIIGSQSGVNLRIIDSHITGEHIRIDYDPQTKQYALTDEHSSNGSRWDGDMMVQKRAYRVKQGRDVTLEMAASYGFVMYIDAVTADRTQIMVSPFANRPESNVEIPPLEPLLDSITASLSWESPQEQIKRNYMIEHNVTIIGRSDNVDVQVSHNLISKTHTYLIWQDNRFYLLDVSSNGTWMTTGAQGRTRVPYGEFVPLDIDTSLIIEIARETVMLDFHYSAGQKINDQSRIITDKLPELPQGVRPLLHIVREGFSDQRKEIRISTGVITIGRDNSSIIPLRHDPVADHHAKIIWQDGKFWLHDLSGMGTTVDAKLLRNSKTPLVPQKIYSIRINEGRPEETCLEFYYQLKDELAGVSKTQQIVDSDNTQRIDSSI